MGYRVTGVDIAISRSGFFDGVDTDPIDERATMDRYVELVGEKLAELYPDAERVVRLGSPGDLSDRFDVDAVPTGGTPGYEARHLARCEVEAAVGSVWGAGAFWVERVANLTVAIRATVLSLADQIPSDGEGNDLESLEDHAAHAADVFRAAKALAAAGWFVTLESPEEGWQMVRFDHPAATGAEARRVARSAYPLLDGVFDACDVEVLFGDGDDDPSCRENLGSLAEIVG